MQLFKNHGKPFLTPVLHKELTTPSLPVVNNLTSPRIDKSPAYTAEATYDHTI